MKLIVQLGYSGFGDRIRVLCSCIHYAVKTGVKVLPIWNDEHWSGDFNDTLNLDDRIAWKGGVSGSTYPGLFAGVDPFNKEVRWSLRKKLLADTAVPDNKDGADIFYLSRYIMKPRAYQEGLGFLTPAERVFAKFGELRKSLPDRYACIHIRNTDKHDPSWHAKLVGFEKAHKNGVVITDSVAVKKTALDMGLVCMSDLPDITPDKGVHHIGNRELEASGFDKMRINDGLIMDIITAGLSTVFYPFAADPALVRYTKSGFSDFIEEGRKHGWLHKHFGEG